MDMCEYVCCVCYCAFERTRSSDHPEADIEMNDEYMICVLWCVVDKGVDDFFFLLVFVWRCTPRKDVSMDSANRGVR